MKRSELRNFIRETIEEVIQENLLPKGKWVKASGESLKRYQEELFNLIKQTYAHIGGHHDFKSPADINTNNADFWVYIDIDDDEYPDAVNAAKTTRFGKKFVVGATDGTSAAKRSLITRKIADLRKSGWYSEVSEKIADILLSANVPVVDNEEDVRLILNKDIEWIGKIPGKKGNGWYRRNIGGNKHIKIMVGKPRI